MQSDNDNQVPKDISTTDGEPVYFDFSATLRVFGQDIDFNEISSALSVKPTSAHRRGERKGPRSPVYKQDMWAYKALLDERAALDLHLLELKKLLMPRKAFLLDLKKRHSLDIFCGYRTNHWGAGFEISSASLELFVALEIPFSVSIVVP